MKYIQLNKGFVAAVDDVDFERANQYSWHVVQDNHTNYAVAYIPGLGNTPLHRFVMDYTGELLIDHRNGCGLDCQRANLRLATYSQNGANRRTGGKLKGVRWRASKQKWETRIVCQGKRYKLGEFESELEAALAYDAKAVELFGEFALTNAARGLTADLPKLPRELHPSDRIGPTILVDFEDYNRVVEHNWYWSKAVGFHRPTPMGYVKGELITLASFILGVPKGWRIGWRNQNRRDHRKENISVVEGSVIGDTKRRVAIRTRKTKLIGVSASRGGKYRAKIQMPDGQMLQIGIFKTEEEAGMQYDVAARHLYGAMAALNYPRRGKRSVVP